MYGVHLDSPSLFAPELSFAAYVVHPRRYGLKYPGTHRVHDGRQ
jgi:hypothetical protein